jgi:hypothetical protein
MSPALTLMASYIEAHPELGQKDAVNAATLLEGGIDLAFIDDHVGRFAVSDSSGHVVVSVDLRPWVATLEG